MNWRSATVAFGAGALVMREGLPYDGDSGRDYAAAITALMHGAAFAQSAKIARWNEHDVEEVVGRVAVTPDMHSD